MKRLAAPLAGLALVAAGFAWGLATAQFGVFPHSLLTALSGYRNPTLDARRDYFAAKRSRPETVFVGDSIFRSIEWSEEFPGHAVANRAIEGDTTADVLARLPDLKRLNASKYVIMLGTNDIGHDLPGAEANIQRIVDALPGLKLVLAVTPCAPSYPGCDQSKIDRLNAKLRRIAGAEFVPVALDPAKDLADKVHPNARGMETIVAAVRPRLHQLARQ